MDQLTVEQLNSHGGTVEHLMVEQYNMLRWNSGTSDGGTGEQKWWKVDQLTDEQLNNYGGTVEHLMLQQ